MLKTYLNYGTVSVYLEVDVLSLAAWFAVGIGTAVAIRIIRKIEKENMSLSFNMKERSFSN